MFRATAILGVLTLVGCTLTSKPAAPEPTARINDVTIPSELDRGYHLVEVDGRPAPRNHGTGFDYFVTYVPYADLKPGAHTFTIERSADGHRARINATIEAGKQYRIDVGSNGTPTLVEYDEAYASRSDDRK